MNLRLDTDVLLCILLSLLLTGCHAPLSPQGDVAVVKQVIEELRATVALVSKPIDTGGGDVNDPVIGWIAVGSPPVCFLVYVLSKRTRLYKWAAGCKKP